MSSKTTNYNLHKIDLTDAPPDITVLNQNWDIIDTKLMPLDGSRPTSKVLFDRSNGAHGDGGIYKANSSGDATLQIMDRGSNNKFGILSLNGQNQSITWVVGTQNDNGSNTTEGTYKLYHEGNKPTATDVGAIAKTGDTMSGNLTFKKAENGEGSIFKNHSASSDYGLVIKDTDKDGDYVSLSLSGSNNDILFRTTNGATNKLYGEHNHGMKLLWTNASPTSDFLGQSVSVNGEGYKKYMIIFYNHATANQIIPPVILDIGETGCGICLNGSGGITTGIMTIIKRNITKTSKTTVTFSDGYQASTSIQFGVSNGAVIPYQIYGIK